jgi:cell division transport system permease protein
MFGFLLGEAWRDLRRAGRVAVSAIVLITLSLTALGGFWMLSANLGRVVSDWRSRVRIVVYLKREPAPGAETETLVRRVRELPDVAAVRFIGKTEALASLRRILGKDAGVLDQLPSNPLPASLEVTPGPAGASPEGARALLRRLEALPEADEVVGGVQWVERLAQWRRLLTTIGLAVGATLALAAVLTVTTSTTLVLHVRRQETEVMRLVGAPESVIRLPLLLQGMMQGLVGALLALAALLVVFRVATPRLEPLLQLTVGLPHVEFLTVPALLAILLAGASFGALGGWFAKGRMAA